MGKIYLVGTPIGNLGDITYRAVETLRAVDFIAAEDTRVTIKLLNHLGIQKPLVSYHEHNQRAMNDKILARITGGENCAVVSDAGMPCISDPGESLVKLCAEHGVEITVIPGASAFVSALALSGLPTGRFSFEGFLSVQKGSRMEHLKHIKDDVRTLIFYEAPHKLPATLRDLYNVLGDRYIALTRELTKLHEEIVRTTLAEAAAFYENPANKPRGEYVIVVAGAQPAESPQISLEDAVRMVRSLQGQGVAASQAAKEVARETGYKKSTLYRAALTENL